MKNIHMHDIKDFINNRYNYKYPQQNYFIDFELGTAVDIAIKQYYLKLPENYTVTKKTNQALVLGMVEAYKEKYKDEMFHDFCVPLWKVPIDKVVVHCSPDLVTQTYHYNERVIMELKTGPIGEALDFQTMCYCWASYRWDFVVPKYVVKRTIERPRIKLKKNETEQSFIERLVLHDYSIKSDSVEVTKNMILEFEKYLKVILKEMQSRNKYKFYRPSNEFWG